jgi:hypothetical protein
MSMFDYGLAHVFKYIFQHLRQPAPPEAPQAWRPQAQWGWVRGSDVTRSPELTWRGRYTNLNVTIPLTGINDEHLWEARVGEPKPLRIVVTAKEVASEGFLKNIENLAESIGGE